MAEHLLQKSLDRIREKDKFDVNLADQFQQHLKAKNLGAALTLHIWLNLGDKQENLLSYAREMADETCSEGTWMRSLDNNVAKKMNKLGESDRDKWRLAMLDDKGGSKTLDLWFRTESSDQISDKSFPHYSYRSWMQYKVYEYLTEDSTSEFPQSSDLEGAEDGPIKITIELPHKEGHEIEFKTLNEFERRKSTILAFVRSQMLPGTAEAHNNADSGDGQPEDEPPDTPSEQVDSMDIADSPAEQPETVDSWKDLDTQASMQQKSDEQPEEEPPDTPSEQVDNIDIADNPGEQLEVVDSSKRLKRQASVQQKSYEQPEEEPPAKKFKTQASVQQVTNRVEHKIGHTEIAPDDFKFTIECLKKIEVGMIEVFGQKQSKRSGPFSWHLEKSHLAFEMDETIYRTRLVRTWLRELMLYCFDAIRESSRGLRIKDPYERAALLIMTFVSIVEREDTETGKERCSYILIVLSETISWVELAEVVDSGQGEGFSLHITKLAKRRNLPYRIFETFSLMEFLHECSEEDDRAKPFLEEMRRGNKDGHRAEEEESIIRKVITQNRARGEKISKKSSPPTRQSDRLKKRRLDPEVVKPENVNLRRRREG